MSFGFGFSLPAYEGYAAGFGATSFGSGTTLALDFLNGNNTLDPRITFSRTTNATLTNSAGLVAYAPHNLLTHSEQFDNAAWTKVEATLTANATIAPDNSSTADLVIPNNVLSNSHGVLPAAQAALAGSTYTLTIHAKAAGYNFLTLLLDGINGGACFNIFTGVVGSRGSSVITSTISSIGGGWYRCSVTVIATSTSLLSRVYVGSADGGAGLTNSYTGDGTSGIYIWGAQLELGNTATTYNPTTVKNLLGYTEHFDNAAWTKSNAFVQTNLLTYSQDFDNAAWARVALGVVANIVSSPDGIVNADTVTASAGTNSHLIQQRVNTLANQIYTYSVFAKYSTAQYLAFGFADGSLASGWAFVTVDIQNGTITQTTNGGGASVTATGAITSVGNGWYRITVTGSYSQIATYPTFHIVNTSTPSFGGFGAYPWTANGTESVYIWGAQLVQGTVAGDYKATYASAAAVGYPDIYGQPFAQKLVASTTGAARGVYVSFAGTAIPYTASVYAKAGEKSLIGFVDYSGINGVAWFNLLTGAVTNVTSGYTASIQNIGSGWYRCSITATPTVGTRYFQIFMADTAGSSSVVADGTSGIYIFGAQLSDSASVDPYVYQPVAAPASTAYYGPRFDYDAVTLAPKGLLIEEQRTNLVLRSEDLTTIWQNNLPGCVTANSAISPDGTQNADQIVLTGGGFQYVFQDVTVVTGQIYTFSFYVKAATVGNTPFRAYADYAGIAATDIAPTQNWVRRTITFTAVDTTAILAFAVPSTGASVNIYLWGAQLEAGAFATSYIPTTSSQVTRAADTASMIGNNFARWYNVTQGTLFAWGSTEYSGTPSTTRPMVNIRNTDDTNRISIRFGSNASERGGSFFVFSNSTTSAQINEGTALVADQSMKFAGAYAVNDFAFAKNNVLVGTDTSGALPVGVTEMQIGAGLLCGNVSRIAYYPRRLANTELQGITS